MQPFQFACPSCEQRITITLGGHEISLSGASDVAKFSGPFCGEYPFVDLHLDFPAYFGPYVRGNTTFLRVVQEIGSDRYHHLNARLNSLNLCYPLLPQIRSAATQYRIGNVKNFQAALKKLPLVRLRSESPEDVVSAIYTITSLVSLPFTIPEHSEEVSSEIPRFVEILDANHQVKFRAFVESISESGFLKSLHLDALEMYPKILEFELPFRSAFFYDYKEAEVFGSVPTRVSTSDFDSCNALYKDLAELFSRQVVIIAALNNLLRRGDHDLFEEEMRVTSKGKVNQDVSSLNSFANVDLGRKLEYIDNPFYNFDNDAIDNKLRNAIAHYKYEYLESNQMIRYFPRKEGMSRDTSIEITFMEFIRRTLLLFREVHNLNHIVKCLLFFRILVMKGGF